MGSDLIYKETSEAFFDGAIPEYESIKRIGTGNAEPQDAMLLLYLLHLKNPTPKEKPVTEEPVKNNTLTEPEPIKKKGDGEAFEAEPLKPNTPEHKAQRWKDYENRMKDNPKKYSYERWSKQYDTNMKNAKFGLSQEQAYRNKFGGKSETLKTKFTNRQIDISKTDELYAGQLKTGKVSLTKQAKIDIIKDEWLVKQGYNVEYILEKGASKNFIDALNNAGINHKIGTQLP
ncbi:hypothetical protein B0A58_00220 [Flavobacterium branchiophilum NBRC 15030 = ATCC 35035]|nr:hypothetical protein B0A58_00220 [Flavobacterium branchiophilum NBRC 15030 = ATCC 35035]